ncbi:MAG: hypothetical protein QNI84_02910 [Henriciella sp.]|nr:hypothetical protein [Henriciella sp.]
MQSLAQSDPNRVQLPCEREHIRAQHKLYCDAGRNYVRLSHVSVIEDWGRDYFAQTGTPLVYLDGSGKENRRLWPHRSHGSGDQLDIALPFITTDETPLVLAPTPLGYGSYEPPVLTEQPSCEGSSRPADFGDPPGDREWRLDSNRMKVLLSIILDSPSTSRIFLEPHLTARLGFKGHPKIGFAGCFAARHDDHIHIVLE